MSQQPGETRIATVQIGAKSLPKNREALGQWVLAEPVPACEEKQGHAQHKEEWRTWQKSADSL